MKNIERISQLIESESLSVRAFEISIGASNGAFGRAIKNGTDVSSEWLSIIIEKYPQYSAEWLLTGKGEMLRGRASSPIYKDSQESAATAMLSDRGIPLIPVDAFAGFGTENSTQVMEYECEQYVVPSFKGAEFLIQVKGSSMYPKYASGDIVACKKLSLDTFFQWNKVYVADTEQGVLIKRIKKGETDGTVLLVSENPNYEPFELRREEISSLAIVIGVIRLE